MAETGQISLLYLTQIAKYLVLYALTDFRDIGVKIDVRADNGVTGKMKGQSKSKIIKEFPKMILEFLDYFFGGGVELLVSPAIQSSETS